MFVYISLSNIRIHVIEPGPVNTGFLDSMIIGSSSDFFMNFNLKSTEFFKIRVGNSQDPADVADVIYTTAINPKSAFRVPTTQQVAERIENAKTNSDIVSNRKQSFIGLWNMSIK